MLVEGPNCERSELESIAVIGWLTWLTHLIQFSSAINRQQPITSPVSPLHTAQLFNHLFEDNFNNWLIDLSLVIIHSLFILTFRTLNHISGQIYIKQVVRRQTQVVKVSEHSVHGEVSGALDEALTATYVLLSVWPPLKRPCFTSSPPGLCYPSASLY